MYISYYIYPRSTHLWIYIVYSLHIHEFALTYTYYARSIRSLHTCSYARIRLIRLFI